MDLKPNQNQRNTVKLGGIWEPSEIQGYLLGFQILDKQLKALKKGDDHQIYLDSEEGTGFSFQK